jgi:hypothetical protein
METRHEEELRIDVAHRNTYRCDGAGLRARELGVDGPGQVAFPCLRTVTY